ARSRRRSPGARGARPATGVDRHAGAGQLRDSRARDLPAGPRRRADRGPRRRHRRRVRGAHALPQGARDRSLEWPAVAEVVNTNQFKNGMHIELDGSVWRIVEFQHVKPGKGGAFVRTKLRSLDSGAVVDRTFRAGEKFARVHTEVKNVQYLYDAGDDVVFMDEESYEQIHLPRSGVADELQFLQPSGTVQMLAVDGRPAGLQMPSA